jgi:hypothetical protein
MAALAGAAPNNNRIRSERAVFTETFLFVARGG